jgi:hypothetical protein
LCPLKTRATVKHLNFWNPTVCDTPDAIPGFYKEDKAYLQVRIKFLFFRSSRKVIKFACFSVYDGALQDYTGTVMINTAKGIKNEVR